MARECGFCPSTATQTGEHLWSDWINKILVAPKFTFVRRGKENLPVSRWQASKLNLKARVVCASCNSTWMSKIDNDEAKPILRHLVTDLHPRRVSLYNLISIGIFAFKTAVVADLMGDGVGRSPIFSREERYRFRESLQIPGGVYMWLGALPHSSRGTFKSRHIEPKDRSKHDFGLYAFTYAAGNFVLQLVAVRWASGDPHRQLPIIEQSSDWETRLISSWPPLQPILWPPPEYLTDSALDEIVDRWSTLKLTT